MSDQVECCVLGVDVDVVIHLVGHFGHLLAGGHPLAADQQLGSVDVNALVNPGRGAAKEPLSNRTEEGFVGSGKGVLARLVNIQYRTARFQYAEMIALDREQRTRNDAFVCNLDGKDLGSKHIGSITLKRCYDLACNRHMSPRSIRSRDPAYSNLHGLPHALLQARSWNANTRLTRRTSPMLGRLAAPVGGPSSTLSVSGRYCWWKRGSRFSRFC